MRAFLDYLKPFSEDERKTICERAGTTLAYVRKATYTDQQAGPELCMRIVRATNNEVTRQALRPGDWARIWPELKRQRAVA